MMKKFLVIGVFVMIVLIVAFGSSAIPNPGHDASEVLISISGYTMNLQEAINNNFLKDGVAVADGSYVSSLLVGHSGDEIQIYLKDVGRMSLQDAITDDVSFCRDASTFSWLFSLGHSADKIIFNDDESLQYKIDNSEFCSYEWMEEGYVNNDCTATATYGDCSETCGAGTMPCNQVTGKETQVVYCKRSDGTVELDKSLCVRDTGDEEPSPSKDCTKDCAGPDSCNLGICPVDCVGSWNLAVGACSVTCGGGNYDKEWTTTTSAVGSGTACPSPTFVDNGGAACNTQACYTIYANPKYNGYLIDEVAGDYGPTQVPYLFCQSKGKTYTPGSWVRSSGRTGTVISKYSDAAIARGAVGGLRIQSGYYKGYYYVASLKCN